MPFSPHLAHVVGITSTPQDVWLSLLSGSCPLEIRHGMGYAVASEMSVDGTWVSSRGILASECISPRSVACCDAVGRQVNMEMLEDQSLLEH